MKPFIFSCDAHVVEPADLFTSAMTGEFAAYAPNAFLDDHGRRVNCLGDTVLFKIPVDFHDHKTGEAGSMDTKRRGAKDLQLRLEDMDRDGVDAELVFPSLGLFVSRITDAEASKAASRIYNDWVWEYLDGLRHVLVPAASVPLVNVADGIEELKYVIDKGFRTVMMPCALLDSCEPFNDPAWDEFFRIAAEAEVPLSFHTGVGNVNIRALRGPGGALFNYTRQMNDATDVIAALVGGGVLDRNPGAHIVFMECGAGWLLGLAERMDEVYFGHAPSIAPKLSRKPSDIVRDQVHCAFQNDPGCLLTIERLSDQSFLFATDYPHSEGTFPFSQDIVAKVMTDPAVTDEQRVNLLGGTASKLYRTSAEQAAAERSAFASV